MTDFIDATVEIHAETERAILASQDGDEGSAIWLPLAQIEVGRRRGKVADVSIPRWLVGAAKCEVGHNCPSGPHGACCGNPAAGEPSPEPTTLTYRNWRGDVSDRTIVPRQVWFGSTEWHSEPQWLLTAWDTEKNAERDFALADFMGSPKARDALAASLIAAAEIWGDHGPGKLLQEAAAAVTAALHGAAPDMDPVDRSDIDRLIGVLRTGKHGSDISNKAADLISSLTESWVTARLTAAKKETLKAASGERSAAMTALAVRDSKMRTKVMREALAIIAKIKRDEMADPDGILPPDRFDEGTSAAYEAIEDAIRAAEKEARG